MTLLSASFKEDLSTAWTLTMDIEYNRIGSFHSMPRHDGSCVSFISLAKAGFYFSEPHIKCFSCGLSLPSLEIEDPVREHRNLAPQCTFITNMVEYTHHNVQHDNISLQQAVVGLKKNLHQINHGAHTEESRLQNGDTVPEDAAIVHQSVSPIRIEVQPEQPGHQQQQNQHLYPCVLDDTDHRKKGGVAFFQRMKLQQERRATYYDFPQSVPQNPDDLAAAGFYYMGMADRTRCAFCWGILRNWEFNDIPMEEHRRHFKDCPFVRGREVGNLPIIPPVGRVTDQNSHLPSENRTRHSVEAGQRHPTPSKPPEAATYMPTIPQKKPAQKSTETSSGTGEFDV